MDKKLILTITGISILIMPVQANEAVKTTAPVESFQAADSEFFDDAQRQKWLQEMNANLQIVSKTHGPFGLLQNPKARVTEKKVASVRQNHFKEAIDAIEVNAVDSVRKSFVIGANEISQGDIVTLSRKGKNFSVKVVSVRSNGIIFKNTATSESIAINPNAKARDGIKPLQGIKTMPGIEPMGHKPSINLDR